MDDAVSYTARVRTVTTPDFTLSALLGGDIDHACLRCHMTLPRDRSLTCL